MVTTSTWQDTWKGFHESPVTHSAAHHLEAVHRLTSEHGYARVTDIARYLGITKASVSTTLKSLAGRDLVAGDDNGFFRLTETGREMILGIEAKRHVLTRFFQQVLGLDPGLAEAEACKIEHLLSTEAGERMMKLVRFLDRNQPASHKFLDAFKKFRPECCDPDECDICPPEARCMLNPDEKNRRGTNARRKTE